MGGGGRGGSSAKNVHPPWQNPRYVSVMVQKLLIFFLIFPDDEADRDPDSESEAELDSDREDLEQPVLLRRPRFLRTPYRRVNSLKEAMKRENYHILPPLEPLLHST